ncbi:unnamed protein product [Leptosia nina]|uniref:Uncharacterized protein n=1 Tax=Leptosia nina TaxID=320188 RepID=A0AAV1JL27_9NEOP
MLQDQLNRLDNFGFKYETALSRINILEKDLCGANQQINSLKTGIQLNLGLETQNQFNELDCGVPHSANINSPSNTGLVRCSNKKLKKYIKNNKFISRTQRLLKKQKKLVSNIKLKQENIELRGNIELYEIEFNNLSLKYDIETQQLHKEIGRLENLTDSLIDKFQESQEMVEKYSSAMDDLLKISKLTAECYMSKNMNSFDTSQKNLVHFLRLID